MKRLLQISRKEIINVDEIASIEIINLTPSKPTAVCLHVYLSTSFGHDVEAAFVNDLVEHIKHSGLNFDPYDLMVSR